MELKYFKKIQADGENDVFHEIDSSLQFSYTALKMSRLLNYSRPIEPLVSLPVEAETISQRTLCRKLADIYAFREQFFFFFFLEIDRHLERLFVLFSQISIRAIG